MKNVIKKLSFVFALSICSKLSYATTISGSILSDLTLTKGTYYLTGTASLAPNAKLTIESGVKIIASPGSQLVIGGSLTTAASSNDPIHFLSSNGSLWGGIQFVNSNNSTFSNVIIEDAYMAVNLNGISKISISNNIFRNNFYGISDYGGYQQMNVSNNTFENNDSALFGIRTSGTSQISYNNFLNNQYVLKGGYYFGTTLVQNNNFLNNTMVVDAPAYGFGYGTLNLESNYWGGLTQNEIPSYIVDIYDNALLQEVKFKPVLTNFITNAGASITPVPEPKNTPMLLLGICLMAGILRRNKQA